MSRFRTLAAVLGLSLGLQLNGQAQADADPVADLLSFANGTRIVQAPGDSDYTQMAYSPLNLIDDSSHTDWTGAAQYPVVFVFEMAESSEIDSLVFDTDFLNFDDKSPKTFMVEVSNSASADGYDPVLSGTLRMNKDNQTFAFKPENRPVGRWVRLTILSNYGNDNVGFTGIHAYGRPLTAEAHLPDVTGIYEGASGWGKVQLTQEGDQVSGCYAYQGGTISGVIVGRVMKLDMDESDVSGADTSMKGLFSLSADGQDLIGIVRNNESYAQDSTASFYSAKRLSNDPARC